MKSRRPDFVNFPMHLPFLSQTIIMDRKQCVIKLRLLHRLLLMSFMYKYRILFTSIEQLLVTSLNAARRLFPTTGLPARCVLSFYFPLLLHVFPLDPLKMCYLRKANVCYFGEYSS